MPLEREDLNQTNRYLSAIVHLLVRQLQKTETELADPRHPSLDSLLADAGLTQREIGKALGRQQSAVSRQLARDGWAGED